MKKVGKQFLLSMLSALGSIALGCVLIYSGVTKLQNSFVFLDNVYSYKLTGSLAGALVAGVVPWLELVLGICLATGILRKGAIASATILLAVFTAAQILAMSRGLKIDCGCFGRSNELVGPASLARTVGLLVLAVFLWWASYRRQHARKCSTAVAHVNLGARMEREE